MCVCACLYACVCNRGSGWRLTDQLSQENKSQETLYLTLAPTQTFFLSLLSHASCSVSIALSMPVLLYHSLISVLVKRGVKTTAVRTTTQQKLPLTLCAVKVTAMTLLTVQNSSCQASLLIIFSLFLFAHFLCFL